MIIANLLPCALVAFKLISKVHSLKEIVINIFLHVHHIDCEVICS